MSTPLFFPPPRYVDRLEPAPSYRPLREWCELAGVRCRASGRWTERPVRVIRAPRTEIIAEASPGTAVLIRLSGHLPTTARGRFVLAALAYALMDGVARESIRGASWTRLAAKVGRPRRGLALSGRERQRRFRKRSG